MKAKKFKMRCDIDVCIKLPIHSILSCGQANIQIITNYYNDEDGHFPFYEHINCTRRLKKIE